MAEDLKLSLAIPYKRRLENLRVMFAGLANQTINRSQFEVVVAVMEYSDAYVTLCRQYLDRLDVVSVMAARSFTIPRARNTAMRQASGRVIVHLDADTLLARESLERLYDRYFASEQEVCIAGKVVGYGNNDASVEAVELLEYDDYRKALADLEAGSSSAVDLRFQSEHVVPWAFAWTGFIALPADTVRRHELFFDEGFNGWGVDDLEWGFRVAAAGIPILLRGDVCALHLPHARDMLANQLMERENYRLFLRKWPRWDVELAYVFGDVEANRIFPEFRRELVRLGHGSMLGSARGAVDGRDVLLVGVALDDEHRIVDSEIGALFDEESRLEILPLAGLALPYEDRSVSECRIQPAVAQLSPKYRETVAAEAHRVARKVVLSAASDGRDRRILSRDVSP